MRETREQQIERLIALGKVQKARPDGRADIADRPTLPLRGVALYSSRRRVAPARRWNARMHRPRSGAQAIAWDKANAGALAFSRDSDPNIGEFEDAATLKTFGEVRGSCGIKNRMIYRRGELQEHATAVELKGCVSERPGHPDHLEKGFCGSHAYQRLCTTGRIYAQARAGTITLYRCYNAKEQSHFASNPLDCGQLGETEHLVGYTISR